MRYLRECCAVCVLLLFSTICSPASVQAQPYVQWQKTYGGSSDDGAASIIQTTDGGFIFAGNTASEDGDVMNLHGHANDDLWVVKLAANDSIEWEIPFGGSNRDVANSIVQTFDGGYAVAGSTTSKDGDVPEGTFGGDDFWVLKLSPTGKIEWQKTLGGSSDDDAYSIIQTADSGFAIAGRTFSNDSEVTGNHGSEDYWIVKLDRRGNLVWQKALGSPGADEAHSIVQTFDGGYAIAGWAGTNGGNVTNEHGSADFWVVKLNATGQLNWQKTYGGSNGDFAYSIVQTPDSGFAVVGSTNSDDSDVAGLHSLDTSDIWAIKIGKTGALEWQKALGGSGRDVGESIVHTFDGGFAIAGFTNSMDGDVTPIIADSGTFDGWILKLDSNGKLQWQQVLGGLADDFLFSIAQTNDHGFVTAGTTSSLLGEGGGFAGSQNAWVERLSDVGNGVQPHQDRLRTAATVFPNPTAGQTEIRYSLNGAAKVLIAIYNCTAECVASKTFELESVGNHSAGFDLSRMPSGAYFYRVLSEGKAQTGAISVVR